MKTKNFYQIGFLVAFALAMLPGIVVAQAPAAPLKPELFYLHEDPVTPAMVVEYEKLSKELVAQCQKFNIQANWLTIQDDDHHYFSVEAIENMADLDKDSFSVLREKMGAEAFGAIFDAFDKCYPSHRDFLLARSRNYSYTPDGENDHPTDYPYRKYHYIYYEPQNRVQLTELTKKIKELNASKGAKLHYNIYISRFGNAENYIIAEELAKDEADYKEKLAFDNKLLGDEINKLLGDVKKLSRRMEEKTGHIRTDLSYFATK